MSKGRQTRDGATVRRVQVMLDEETVERAKALGKGNLSAGIRKATKEAAMKRHQLEAICQMAEATHEYNLGVLCMLGHELLARRHESAAKWVTMLVSQRDMLTPDDASPLDPLPPEAEKIQAEIDAEVRHRNAMWAPIQAIIDEARKALDEADPMGMGQAVTQQEARDAAAQMAGYESEAEMEERLGQPSEIVAEEAPTRPNAA